MNKSLVAKSIAVTICFIFALDALAKSPSLDHPQNQWNQKVQSLTPGAIISIHTKIGTVREGKLISLTDHSIRIDDLDNQLEFHHSMVSRIGVVRLERVDTRNTIITGVTTGALFFGLGYGLPLHSRHPSTNDRLYAGAIAAGVLGGAFTLDAAAAGPQVKECETIIYKSK